MALHTDSTLAQRSSAFGWAEAPTAQPAPTAQQTPRHLDISDLPAHLSSEKVGTTWLDWLPHRSRRNRRRQADADLLARIRQPIEGDYRIAVLSVKGGVGKTTTTIGLGATFASLRGDRVIAIDANPDYGTLAGRMTNPTDATIRCLLSAPSPQRYDQIRAFTTQSEARLEILASDHDPQLNTALSAADYAAAIAIVRKFYNLILTDCGTGLVNESMQEVLQQSNSLVLVTTPALDGVTSAWATLDWLSAHGYASLVSRTVVVLNRLTMHGLDDAHIAEVFSSRCRAFTVIPYDAHIARGADIDIEQLAPETRQRFRTLAAMIADDFAPNRGRHNQAQ